MNERIRELWEQAAETTQGDSWQEQTKFMERYTELVVRECMKLNSKELSITAIERLLPLYKEHFGVEE